jgi:peptidyl-dipeptidase A
MVASAVSDVEAVLRPLATAANMAWWEANVESSGETERRRVQAELELSDFLADPEAFAAIEAARAAAPGGHAGRELQALHDWFLPRQVPQALRRRIVELEASVEARFARHRGVVRGAEVTDNDIVRILRTSDDVAERREAWEASKTVGAAVGDDVRELARLRNEAARSLGFRDWFALALATTEMDEGRLWATLEEADRATAEQFARWKGRLDERLAARFGCAVADLRPWHYDDPFFQALPVSGGVDLDGVVRDRDLVALASRTFDELGLATEGILSRSDLYPRGGKCQHAFCIDVDRAGDVRVLTNLEPTAYWMDTLLHELGHGVYSEGFDGELPWLLRDCHVTVTEGIAILCGRLGGDAEWLTRVAGLPAGEAEQLAAPLRADRAAELLLFARWVLVMTNFERSLYADPDGDLDGRWWELVRRHQLVTPPDGRRAPDWAAKIHVACAPVYYHTYLYGQLVASQLAGALRREEGGLVGRETAGRYLGERVFRPGGSVRWDHLVEQATGEPLAARHFADDIAAGAIQ